MPAKADDSFRAAAPFLVEDAPVEPVEPLLDAADEPVELVEFDPTMSVVAVSLYMSFSGYFMQRPIDSSCIKT